MRDRHNGSGFSLMEVNLAILVVALGMLTLFALFPAGLKQVETAQATTQEAMFAGHVLSSLRGNAMRIVNASDWSDIARFRDRVVADISGSGTVRHGIGIETVQFPAGLQPPQYIRYLLDISDAGNDLRMVSLWCRSGEYGATDLPTFRTGASKYYTELFYTGMP